jgi:hypothetical protein
VGLSLTGFTDHDRDRGQPENSGLFLIAPTVSLELATDWIAFLIGASVPYQYDGRFEAMGRPRTPWAWGAWSVSAGFSIAPF